MIFSRSGLAMKLWSMKIQPSASNSSIMAIITPRMLNSGGRRRRARGAGSIFNTVSLANLVSPGLARRKLHDADLGRVLAVENAGHAALMHHHHAVAHAEHFGQFGGDHQH